MTVGKTTAGPFRDGTGQVARPLYLGMEQHVGPLICRSSRIGGNRNNLIFNDS